MDAAFSIQTLLPTKWSQDENGHYVRVKNGKKTIYHKGSLMGSGGDSKVYELIPINTSKHKVVKISLSSNLKFEFELIQKINRTGPVKGLLKASKAMFKHTENGVKSYSIILSKYDYSLKDLIVKRAISEQELFNCIQDIVKGLEYLQSQDIVHNDLCFANILVGKCQNNKPFVLCDYEKSLDLSEITSFQDYYALLSTLNKSSVSQFLEQPKHLQIIFAKQKIKELDVEQFGLWISTISRKWKTPLTIALGVLGEEIKKSKTVNGVSEKLKEIGATLNLKIS